MIPIAKPVLGQEEVIAAGKVIVSGWVSQGPKVKQFEDAFAAYVGAKHACAVSNCTTALHLALLAVGVKAGDRVITVSHSFIATANSVRYCGAEPVFVDIDPQTYNMDPAALESCLKKMKGRAAAILVVHQMGRPCDLKNILVIAKRYRLPVVEDAACAIGSEISFDNGKHWEKIGRPHGDIACFSFHPRKVITTGEGGMITTRSAKIDAQLRLLRHQGMNVSDLKRHQSKKIIFENYPVVGFNYRMTDIQAAVGIEQLKRLPAILARRPELTKRYFRELSSLSWLQLPREPEYARTNWQSFPVKVLHGGRKTRDRLMQYLMDRGVSSRPGIMNAHTEKPYQSAKNRLPNSEKLRDQTLLIPLFDSMNEQEQKLVIDSLKSFAIK